MDKDYSIILGIDPGIDGGICAIDEEDNIFLHNTPTKGEEIDWRKIYEIITEYDYNSFGNTKIGTEDLHSIYGTSANSNFKFGGSFRGLIATLEITQLNYTLIAPKKWQAQMFKGIPRLVKDMKNDTKAMALLAAKQLAPNCTFIDKVSHPKARVPHNGLVDAFLIAKYIQNENNSKKKD